MLLEWYFTAAVKVVLCSQHRIPYYVCVTLYTKYNLLDIITLYLSTLVLANSIVAL